MHKDETATFSSGKGDSKRQKAAESSPDEASESNGSVSITSVFESQYPIIESFDQPPCSMEDSDPTFNFTDEDLAILIHPSRDVVAESLGYFFTNYVNTPRDPSTNIFIEHILPMYLNTPIDSALSDAIHAVAMNITSMWMKRWVDSYHAREAYGKAVTHLKTLLEDPVQCKTDETLATVFMLDFYDSLNQRFVQFVDTGTHQQGAVVLLKHRGEDNFKTPLSQRLFNAMRSRHINYALQAGRKVVLDPSLLTDETAVLPSAKLDLLNVDLADLHVLARGGPEAANLSLHGFYEAVMERSLVLEKKLQAWRETLPKSWQPVPIPASQLHPSIREAGLYLDMCDVYSSLAVSHVNNAARSSHVGTLRLIALCLRGLKHIGATPNPEIETYVAMRTQEIVDRFCASIPFHLGNRTSITFPHEHREYPQIPTELRRLANYVDPFGNEVEMTMEDHARAAAAIGGWFIMTPLAGFLKAPAMREPEVQPGPLMRVLRPGQLEWIRGQMQRIQKIYLFPTGGFQQYHDWTWVLKQMNSSLEQNSRISPARSPLPFSQRVWGS